MESLGDWPIFAPDIDLDEAQATLSDAGLSDGLPLVPPTTDRLATMLAGIRNPEAAHGLMPPLFGELTAARIAYNCTLAGCPPGAVPVVLTACAACLEPEVNLLGLATTTGAPAVAAIVHGPAGPALDMNDGVNCLAPGNRANATLGRAIALALRNVAGMATGIADMATMGQPAKYGLCFAEAAASPFPPWHAGRGFAADDSAVTVLGISGTAEVLPSIETGNWDTPEDVLEPVALMMHAALVAGGGARKPESASQVLLLPPELAILIARRGWQVDAIRNHLAGAIDRLATGSLTTAPDDIHVVVTGGPGVKMTVLPLWGGGTRAITHRLIEA